jgi:hypothetical protein
LPRMADFAGALGDVAGAAGEHKEQCGEYDFEYTTAGEFCPFDTRLRAGVVFTKLGEQVERFFIVGDKSGDFIRFGEQLFQLL